MAQAGGSKDFPWADEVKKEMEQIEKAEIGNPKTPLNKTPFLSEEVVEKLNEGIAFKYNAALIFDSAAAFFGRDNVIAVGERANAMMTVDFLNVRGANVKFRSIAEPPSENEWHTKEMSDVLKAFLKALAIAKVGYNCAHKLYGEAQKKNDAHTVLFVEKQIFEAGEKMRCLAWYVSHLKCVEGDKHAIKNFDRELECKTPCLAKAAGIEAVIPCKLQIGYIKRAHCMEAFAPSWKFVKEEVESGEKMVV
ncbi:g8761 [Coccomyxa elongata]